MLIAYINAALALAQYVQMKDGSYYGEIPELGIECSGKTLEECQRGLRGMIRDWVTLTLRAGELVPIIDGIDLNQAGAVHLG